MPFLTEFSNEIIISQKRHMKTLKIFCSNSMAHVTADYTGRWGDSFTLNLLVAKHVTNLTICICFKWPSITLFQHQSCSPLTPVQRQPSSPQYQISSLHTFFMGTTEVENGRRRSYPLDGSLTRLGRTTPIPSARRVFSSYTPNSQIKVNMLTTVHG